MSNKSIIKNYDLVNKEDNLLIFAQAISNLQKINNL